MVEDEQPRKEFLKEIAKEASSGFANGTGSRSAFLR
jgi:hypothetical protein